MLKISIELIPFGILDGKLIGLAEIVNDGTGTEQNGNYIFRIYNENDKIWKEVKIKNFKRLEEKVWKLLYLGLTKIYGEKYEYKKKPNKRKA